MTPVSDLVERLRAGMPTNLVPISDDGLTCVVSHDADAAVRQMTEAADRIEELERERDARRAYMRKASIALCRLTPGGSEWFTNVAGEPYAEPDECVTYATKMRHRLSTQLRDAMIERKAKDRAESKASRLEEENRRLKEALEWYGEQTRLCRLLGSAGDPGRHALDHDGGKRARTLLSQLQEPS